MTDSKLDREMRQEAAEIGTRMARLTSREREVLELIVAGKTNKAIAAELDISIKTVEVHRAKVMEKMRAGSMAGLLHMYSAFAARNLG